MTDEATKGSGEEPSTVDAPARWSGSAAVPPPAPKRSRWSRKRPAAAPQDAPTDALPPPVDPWEGQDTPWDPMPLPVVEGAEPMPPTRIEPPAAPVNRVPVQPRPDVTYPPPPPKYQKKALHKPQSPPPPPAAPKQQRPLPPPRRRRKWPRRLALTSLLGVLCCCGIPGYFAWPAYQQYPVTAVLPESVSDLNLRDDADGRRAAQRLSDELSSADAFAGVYSDGNGKRVTVFGTTGLRLTPKQDAEAQIRHLTADYQIQDVTSHDVGVTGVHERCGVGRSERTTVVVCVWADHGSLATVLTTRRSVDDTAELTGVLRNAVLVRG